MVDSGLRKQQRKDPIQISVMKDLHPLIGAVYAFGKIGCLDENTKIRIPLKKSSSFCEFKSISLKNLPNKFKVFSLNIKTDSFEIQNAEKSSVVEKECHETIFPDNTKVICSKDHKFAYYVNKKLEYLTIESIWDLLKLKHRPVGIKRCFDLFVENNHSFLLENGYVSHNSGKTVSILGYAQMYHDHPAMQYKIFDIWGGDRNEHLYWTLPSNKINYWKNAEKILRLDKPGPKQYKVNLLYPLTNKIRKKLPSNPPYVKSKVFTINYKDLKIDDFALLIGNLSIRDEAIWKDALYHLKKGANLAELMDYFRINKAENYTIFKSIIKPLINNGMIQDEYCNLNIKIEEEVYDQESISVLSLDFIDKEYRLFIAGYIIRKITEALDRKHKKTILIFREASEIFRVTDQSVVPDRVKVFKGVLSQWVRMGRRGCHFLLDCLDENTLIKVKRNNNWDNVAIKDLCPEEIVQSYNFINNKIESKDANVFYVGEKECYEIELKNGKKIIATDNHRFFNEKNKENFVRNLKKGDKILSC